MSEFGVGREVQEDTAEEPAGLEIGSEIGSEIGPEPVEEYVEADPQEWISSLVADLERAEQGIGSGPRDVLMARIKLAQAYSELGDTVQAAPLAVQNFAQAERLFPSSEGMLRQLREFRDAACEAAGWTAAMMRQPDEAEPEPDEEPSDLVARPGPTAEALAQAWPPVDAAEPLTEAAPVHEQPEPLAAADPAPSAIPEPHQIPERLQQTPESEPVSVGAVIHEFVRRTAESAPAAAPPPLPPTDLAIPEPPEPEYAEEIPSMLPATDITAVEEIIRLRYELREAHRTIDRLRHVNRKLREALDFEAE